MSQTSLTYLDRLNKEGLLTYYLLPQLHIQLTEEFLEHIVRTRVNALWTEIWVEVDDAVEFIHLLNMRGVCSRRIIYSEKLYVVFELTGVTEEDIELVKAGKYSHTSKEFKSNVKAHSLLSNYKMDEVGIVWIDALIMALERHVVMRDYISSVIGETIPEDSELLPCLGPEDIVSLDA